MNNADFKNYLSLAKNAAEKRWSEWSRFTMFILRPSKPHAHCELSVKLTTLQFARLVAWHLYDSSFNMVSLYSKEPRLYNKIIKAAESRYDEVAGYYDQRYPYIVAFDDAIAAADKIRKSTKAQPDNVVTLDIVIDGGYYYDYINKKVPIELSNEEIEAVKNILRGNKDMIDNDYENGCDVLEYGLLPVLKAASKPFYKKFYNAIYPEVFCELFDEDALCGEEELTGIETDEANKDYLLITYGDYYNCKETFMCYIPTEWLP